MRTWKKILTLVVFMMLACITVTACNANNKYAKMTMTVETDRLVDNSITLSNKESENYFTIKVTVGGVASDVSKKVNFVVDNPALLKILPPETKGDITTARVIINQLDGNENLSSDKTFIRVLSEEGGKTESIPVKVIIPLQDIVIHKSSMPIIRGQSIDNFVDSDMIKTYWSYFPGNTNQDGVKYVAEAINDNDTDDVQRINDSFASSGKFIIPSDTHVKSFNY